MWFLNQGFLFPILGSEFETSAHNPQLQSSPETDAGSQTAQTENIIKGAARSSQITPGDSDCTRACQVTHSCQGSFLPLSPRQPNKVEGRSRVKVAGGSSEMAVPSLPSLSPLLADWMSSGWSGHLLSDQSEFSVDGNCFRTAQEELRRPRAPVGRFNSAADILRFALFRPLIYGRAALDSMFSFIVSISSVWCFTTSP